MGKLAASFVEEGRFLPHGYCIAWDTPLATLHVVSDSLIALAYYSIPLTLLYFLLRRPLQRYRWVVGLFAGFILACGTTHLMAVVTLWEPVYWADGLIKAGTALVSLATAVLIWPLVPRLAALPLPAELAAVNDRLRREIDERGSLEGRFRSVVDAVPNALVIVDREGRIGLVNDQTRRWFGYTREELIGQPVEMLVPERFRGSHPEHRGSYMADPAVRPMGTGRELYARRKDGSEFPVDISLSPVDTPEGPQVISAITDMTTHREAQTELARSNQALESVNRELESFAYSVSHDLRAPLRAMTGFAEIVLQDYSNRLDADGTSYLQRIRAAAERMGGLIDDLLALSRVTRSELHREPVDVSALAREIADGLQERSPEREMALEIEPDLAAEADPHLLRILLDNLLSNAWKFTRNTPDANVRVAQAEDDGECVFLVQDNGAGFDMAYASKLFGAFQRLHGQDEFPGTGIGLATAQRIVLRHGGRMWAEGAVGKGATFYFTLP